MADVELPHLRDGGDRLDVVIGEAVAGMDLDAVLGGERGGVGEAAQLRALRLSGHLGIAAGVQLDDRRAERQRRLDLLRIGLDEERDADLGVAQLGDHRREMRALAGRVEPAFGRPLLALFGDDAGSVGAMPQGDREHLIGRRHFEVKRDGELGGQPGDVVVGDVAAILAQMRGDAIGARLCRDQAGADRIGIAGAARVPDRRDVIDVDAKAQRGSHAAFRLPGFSAGKAASSGGSESAG